MNTKVVIVWIVAVIIFAAIGLFGMANQHLLNDPDKAPAPTNPNDNKGTFHYLNCTAKLSNGDSSYSFVIDDESNKITDVTINYQATVPMETIYNSASVLANASIGGVTTTLSGSAENFVVIIKFNINGFDANAVSGYQNDFNNLSAVVRNIDSTDAYESAINDLVSSQDVTYNCN